MSQRPLARCQDCGGSLGTRIKGAVTQDRERRRPELKSKPFDPVRVGYERGESDGKVYCSNADCQYDIRPHPTRMDPNRGT